MQRRADDHVDPTDREEGDVTERAALDRLKRMGISAWHEPLLIVPKSFEDYTQTTSLRAALPRNDVIAIESDPDESYLWTAIAVECDQVCGGSRFYELSNLLRYLHGSLLVKFPKICYDTGLYRHPNNTIQPCIVSRGK